MADISADHYAPRLKSGFMGAPQFHPSSTNPIPYSFYQNFRDETISRIRSIDFGRLSDEYTPHPSKQFYQQPNKYLNLPMVQGSMIDHGRQQAVDDFYIACQMHRDQYKDHTGTLHPLDYFKPSDYNYQCPKGLTSVYLKSPERYLKYRDPIVFPLTFDRSINAPSLPQRALTGVYDKSSFVGRM